MDLFNLLVVVLSMISLSHCCSEDYLWDIVTCGPVTVGNLNTLTTNGDVNLCGNGTLLSGKIDRDVVRSVFTFCQKNKLSTCSASQQKELPVTFIESALNTVPCDVVNDATPPPACASGFIKCLNNAAASLVKAASKGSACTCAEKAAVKATLATCTAGSPLGSCSGLTSTHQTALTTSQTQLNTLIDGFSCTGINLADCTCYNNIKFCIADSAHGNMPNFINQPWSLIESHALTNESTNTKDAETTRAWRRYQQCRTLGYPDQLDRAVACIVNSTYVNQQTCDISFPETLAFAEHDGNTTFYQTLAAAAKNMQDFCHVWCRNTTKWTGAMLECLSGFHPPNSNQQGTENVIEFINNHPDHEIKAICDNNPTLVDQELVCASNTIKDCPYLPYHILIADKYGFQETLTTSDAMEAVYKILHVCGKNATSWALTAIAERDSGKTSEGGSSGDAFTGFFSSSPRTAFVLESPLLLILAVTLIFMA